MYEAVEDINLLPTVSHFSGLRKQVYFVTECDEMLCNRMKFLWFERSH